MAYFSTVFQQILQIIPRHRFENLVKSHQSDRYVKTFTSWNQLITFLYSQATSKDSLRDIVTGLKVQFHKWYHLGIKTIARSTISHANKNRDYRIFERLFYELYHRCRYIAPKHRFRFKNPLFSLDATVIDLCLSLFPWAKFRKRKGAIKLHCILDHRGEIPSFIVDSDGKSHDVAIAKKHDFPLSPDSIIAVDRAYIDFQWLFSLSKKEIFFVTRAKNNFDYHIIGQHNEAKQKNVLSDEIISLSGFYPSKYYPEDLRLITYYDNDKNKIYRFLTNNFKLAASTIAGIYKARWQIEIFFKWIKQNLKIKTFLGTSKNAVLSQIWVAMCYYLTLSYIKFQTKYKFSLLHLTRIIQETLFERVCLIDLLNLSAYNLFKVKEDNLQLTLF